MGRYFVYFAQIGTDGPIKIGVTNLNPAYRFRAIQQGMPFKIRSLGILKGVERSRERELHEQFAACHVYGEWFDPSPELSEFISNNASPLEMRPYQPRGRFLHPREFDPTLPIIVPSKVETKLPLDKARSAAVRWLASEGYTFFEIGEIFKVTERTVYLWAYGKGKPRGRKMIQEPPNHEEALQVEANQTAS